MDIRGWAVPAVIGALLLVGCGARRPTAVWTTELRWGADVSIGHQSDGATVGPLAVAAGSTSVILADSFGHRLLIWRWEAGAWVGPEARPVPARSPIVAVALVPVAGPLLAVAADGSGHVWAVPASGDVVPMADLHAPPGDLRTVVSLTVAGDGSPIADVIDVSAERSSRTLLAIAPDGALRTIAEAEIARVGLSDPTPPLPWSLSPRGVRAALAAAPGGGLWIAARGTGGPAPVLARVGLDGRVLGRRRMPELNRADFLGVDTAGLAYAVDGVGTPGARVVVFNAQARVVRAFPVPFGDGPLLPHPAALAPDGALLLLDSDAQGVRLLRLPPGSRGQPQQGRGNFGPTRQ